MNKDFGLKLVPNYEGAVFSEKEVNSRLLSKPTLNSTLRYKNQIDDIKKAKFCSDKTADDAVNKQKLTTKLNFGMHQKVFRNLTPINVNDSLLQPKSKIPIPKKYIHTKDTIPVPDLRDFLDDVPPLKYTIEEPEIIIDAIEYDFDVLLNYKLFKV